MQLCGDGFRALLENIDEKIGENRQNYGVLFRTETFAFSMRDPMTQLQVLQHMGIHLNWQTWQEELPSGRRSNKAHGNLEFWRGHSSGRTVWAMIIYSHILKTSLYERANRKKLCKECH